MFQQELAFFKANQNELLKQYIGKILVIKGSSVLGVYENTIEAYNNAIKDNEPGTFMIQPCEPGPEAYTITLYSLGIIRH